MYNYLLLLLAAMAFSCSQKHDLVAEIKGLGSDTIHVFYAPLSDISKLEDPFLDTIYSKNDRFSYDLPTDEPILFYLFPRKGELKRMDGSRYQPPQKVVFLLLQPGKTTTLSGTLKDYYLEYEVDGSTFNTTYAQLRSDYISKTAEAAEIELLIDSLNFVKADWDPINQLFQKRNAINSMAREAELDYVKEHPNTDLAAYLLASQRLDTLGRYYALIGDEVKEGIFKTLLSTRHTKYQKFVLARRAEIEVVPGNKAPDFTLKTPTDELLRLHAMKKEYTVLDFWGSWCKPCIIGFPKMKAYYSKYQDRVEILGIACNDTELKWRNAIAKYDLNWQHVINQDSLLQDISVRYGVQNYPTKFILDQNFEIIAKFEGEGDDFYEKLDELLGQ